MVELLSRTEEGREFVDDEKAFPAVAMSFEDRPSTATVTAAVTPPPSNGESDGGFPLAPPPSSSSPPPLNQPPSPPLCAGCSLRITDSEYLTGRWAPPPAASRSTDGVNSPSWSWHPSCLRCGECGADLRNERAFLAPPTGGGGCGGGGLRCGRHFVAEPWRCFACGELMSSPEAEVIRSWDQRLFHVECFRCAVCAVQLRHCGKYAADADSGMLLCPQHRHLTPSSTAHAQPPPPPPPPSSSFYAPPHHPSPPFPPPHFGPHPHLHPHLAMDPAAHWYGPPGGPSHPPQEFPVGPPQPGDFPYDNNNEPVKKKRGRKKRKVPETFAPLNGFLEGAYPPGGLDASGQSKVKRARTSFKHHQLRIMKAHFQINQNPDSRELKMLSQKTGLDKKVLQVWFQNARAKWRRTKAQDGSSGLSSDGGGGTVPGGPSSSGSNPPGGHQGGDPLSFVGETSPPSSDDCSGPLIPCY